MADLPQLRPSESVAKLSQRKYRKKKTVLPKQLGRKN
jgi:hypothetical protein